MGNGPVPLRDAALYATWGVGDRAERLRLLRALADGREMVTLHAGDDDDCFVVSRVLGVDTGGGTLELEFHTDEGRHDAFRHAGRAIGVALLDRVTLQFDLECPTFVGDGECGRLRTALPERLARMQRRDAFRVSPPASAVPVLRLAGDGAARPVRVLDVSATGIAFEWDGANAGPAPGTRLAGCRLELPAAMPIRCDLMVRGVEPLADPYDDPHGGALRVGCAFEGLDPPSARAIQVYVNVAQTRGRRVRPRLG
ncbi:MAG: hypothetical protein RJA99_3291 [Pseudomonadota bacterium]|jgi:c-di-GMP-binding flagellar brake protein YcgR